MQPVVKAARARGREGGRPVKFTEDKKKLARKLFEDKNYTIKQISKHLQLSTSTVYHYHAQLQQGSENTVKSIDE